MKLANSLSACFGGSDFEFLPIIKSRPFPFFKEEVWGASVEFKNDQPIDFPLEEKELEEGKIKPTLKISKELAAVVDKVGFLVLKNVSLQNRLSVEGSFNKCSAKKEPGEFDLGARSLPPHLDSSTTPYKTLFISTDHERPPTVYYKTWPRVKIESDFEMTTEEENKLKEITRKLVEKSLAHEVEWSFDQIVIHKSDTFHARIGVADNHEKLASVDTEVEK